MRRRAHCSLIGLALSLAACSSATPEGGDAAAPDFHALYADVVSRYCQPCHRPEGLFPDLDFSSETAAYRGLVAGQPSSRGVCQSAGPIVAAGDCEHSLLYRKLLPENVPCGSRMPLRDVPVSEQGIAEVCAWIAAGARE